MAVTPEPSLLRDFAAARTDYQLVDPRKINRVYAGHLRLRALGRDSAAVPDGDWDRELWQFRFTDLDEYRGLVQHAKEGLPWEQTRYGVWAEKRVGKSIKKGRSTRETAADITAEYYRRFDEVYESIAANGYRSQGDLQTKYPLHEIEVAIDRDGRYIFVDGRHRLAAARVLEVPEVPVRVVARHPEWVAFHEFLYREAESRNGILYHQVAHPDLRYIPAQHEGTGRIDLVIEALADVDPEGKHLLDIGANWGQASQIISELGFWTTGVEANHKDAWANDKIRMATDSSHRVWWGSIFDFPDVEKHEVILALNVFHHLIATQDRFERLEKLLPRFRADVVIFEPHRALDSPKFMTRAYRNFTPDDFAQWVAEKAGMSTVEPQGVAPDGRPVYKLLR